MKHGRMAVSADEPKSPTASAASQDCGDYIPTADVHQDDFVRFLDTRQSVVSVSSGPTAAVVVTPSG